VIPPTFSNSKPFGHRRLRPCAQKSWYAKNSTCISDDLLRQRQWLAACDERQELQASYGLSQLSWPDGLKNALEYSARTTHRAHEELQDVRRIRSEICRPDVLHREYVEGPIHRRAVAEVDPHCPKTGEDRWTQICGCRKERRIARFENLRSFVCPGAFSALAGILHMTRATTRD
jgi:hypothetical protein